MSNPADYPQFAFRLSPSEKEELMDLIERVKNQANKNRPPGEKVVKKNDIIVKALLIGLEVLQANPKKHF